MTEAPPTFKRPATGRNLAVKTSFSREKKPKKASAELWGTGAQGSAD